MIVFVSNFLSHHQKPFSDEIYRLTKGDYRFVSTEPMREERKNLGWGVTNPEYVLENFNSDEDFKKCQELIDNADIVIFAGTEDLLKNRKKNGKIIVRYSERPLKKKEPLKFLPRMLKWHLNNPRKSPIYMLCASAYTAPDFKKLGLFKNKTYKWGYFTECKRYENIDTLISQKKENSILWVGRVIDCKHPEIPVLVAKKLQENGYSFNLDIIGTGEMEETVKQMVSDNKLDDCIHLLGAKKPEEVREYMEKSSIFMFTSDRGEGWGAVLNESMNSGCAVVANRAIGSVPFLLENGNNGYIYDENASVEDIYNKVKYLLDNPKKREQIGRRAYDTVANLWSPEIAAKRFLDFCEEIKKSGRCDLFEDGPCSRAV